MGDRNTRDLRLLLVEDLEDTRFFMRLELEELGFIVFEAVDGRSAVDVAVKESPDIILMDLTLPLMDGLAATKLIRKKGGKLQKVPIIAVTGHQETDFRLGAKESGFDAYVTKPIDMKSLRDLIDGLLL